MDGWVGLFDKDVHGKQGERVVFYAEESQQVLGACGSGSEWRGVQRGCHGGHLL